MRNECSRLLEARGFVRTDTEYSELLQVPLVDVLKKTLELRGRPHELLVKSDPFAGLASQRPVRAFVALTRAAKRDDYPLWAWKTFLYADNRKSDKPKFTALRGTDLAIANQCISRNCTFGVRLALCFKQSSS
jgi:hypothetical protein